MWAQATSAGTKRSRNSAAMIAPPRPAGAWFESLIWPDGRSCPKCGSHRAMCGHAVWSDPARTGSGSSPTEYSLAEVMPQTHDDREPQLSGGPGRRTPRAVLSGHGAVPRWRSMKGTMTIQTSVRQKALLQVGVLRQSALAAGSRNRILRTRMVNCLRPPPVARHHPHRRADRMQRPPASSVLSHRPQGRSGRHKRPQRAPRCSIPLPSVHTEPNIISFNLFDQASYHFQTGHPRG